VLVAVVAFLMARWAGFSYRSYNIHLAVMFGTIMAWNVWFRIWPAQQKIIRAVKDGTAPTPRSSRSRAPAHGTTPTCRCRSSGAC
jgi:uncharacterized membrane protein